MVHEARSGSADYFDNVMTKFMINNRTDALKTDVHLFFTITTGQNDEACTSNVGKRLVKVN